MSQSRIPMQRFFPLLLAAFSFVQAQDRPDRAKESPEVGVARKRMEKLTLQFAKDETSVERIDKPLHVFSDKVRGHDTGTLWAWGAKGRPVAMLELFQLDAETDLFMYGLIRTGEADLRMHLPTVDGSTWRPVGSNLKWHPLNGVSVPEDTEESRLRQMKDIAARFTATEFWRNQTHELKLLPTHIHRYSDVEADLTDGAIFVLAHGTNPEVLLFVEALKDKDAGQWQYGVARCCAADFQVFLDRKEVHSSHSPNGFQDLQDSNGSVWFGIEQSQKR